MNKTILNWNGIDHNAIYTGQLREHPLYYDTNLKLWVTYSYEYCKAVLLDSDAHVPQQVIDSNSALNDKATLLLGKMARINNNMQHTVSRSAAMTMFQSITAVAVDQVLEALLSGIKDSFDWVETIGKRLPVQLILKGLGFSEEDAAYITENLESMARIMSPNKTGEDIKLINAVINRFYELAEKYVGTAGLSGDVQETELAICNLIGLFIQSYDAGWGLLCIHF
jgi:cytochrome P450